MLNCNVLNTLLHILCSVHLTKHFHSIWNPQLFVYLCLIIVASQVTSCNHYLSQWWKINWVSKLSTYNARTYIMHTTNSSKSISKNVQGFFNFWLKLKYLCSWLRIYFKNAEIVISLEYFGFLAVQALTNFGNRNRQINPSFLYLQYLENENLSKSPPPHMWQFPSQLLSYLVK